MQSHMKSRQTNRRLTSLLSSFAAVSLIVLVLVSGSDAIVKQSQQQQQQQQQPTSQQQRSDDSSQVSGQSQQQQPAHHQSAYNNHQSPSSASSSASSQQSGQPSYSSSVSVSSSQSAPQTLPASSQSQAQSSASSVGQNSAGTNQQSGYINYGAGSSGSSANQALKPSSSYMDAPSASASANDQSYLAAANSVNMALANSGIYGASGSAGYAPSPAVGASQVPAASRASNSPQSLNPLHYFYYPAKDSGSSVQAKASNQGADIMANSASNNYQSMAFPSYADQLNSALSGMSSGQEAAASAQDPSYLPQSAMPNNQMSTDNSNQASSMFNGQLPSANAHQSQQQGAGSQSYADLSGYSSNINPSAAVGPQNQQSNPSSSISFNGPSNAGIGNGQSGDYLNSHMGGQGHQQVPPISAYTSSNLYSQAGDLMTSNFGNNGGVSSVASYLPPNQQHQGQGSQQDMFANPAMLGNSAGQQFNSAASQISSAVSSPNQQVNTNGAGGSLYSAASSLFNQQPSPAGQMFSNQQYLNSFLNPHPFNQLGGQQGSIPSSDHLAPAASTSSSSVASGGSSKRFGISSFIMPMLALAGLSLLIPTMSNIGTAVGRKKRSIEDRATASNRQQQISFDSMNGASQMAKEMSIGEYMDKIERYYSIYKSAVESDDCLSRLICEFGDAVKDIAGKSAVLTVMERLAPTWMEGKVNIFKDAALNNKEGKEKCKKFSCNANKHQQ